MQLSEIALLLFYKDLLKREGFSLFTTLSKVAIWSPQGDMDIKVMREFETNKY
jgi:hypothetical protein